VDVETIEEARFDPQIRLYLWVLGGILLIVSVLGIPLLGLWMLGGYFWATSYYNRLHCYLTETHLIFVSSILTEKTKSCSLASIRSMRIEANPLLNWFGLKSLVIEFAEEEDSIPDGIRISGISNTRGFRNLIQFQIDKKHG